MTEITREQLELAALEGGVNIEHFDEGAPVYYVHFRGLPNREYFEPHTDIADAARLAVRLGMWVNRGMASAFVGSEVVEVVVGHNDTAPDMERAYCEAVTLCAAEIGRRMKEAK